MKSDLLKEVPNELAGIMTLLPNETAEWPVTGFRKSDKDKTRIESDLDITVYWIRDKAYIINEEDEFQKVRIFVTSDYYED